MSDGAALINGQSVAVACYAKKVRTEGAMGTIAVAEL